MKIYKFMNKIMMKIIGNLVLPVKAFQVNMIKKMIKKNRNLDVSIMQEDVKKNVLNAKNFFHAGFVMIL